MTPASHDDPAAAPAALRAFLRGVERRGAVFAWLQVGDVAAGDAALAEAMVAFHDAAGATPFAEWPRCFWTLLLAAPSLRGERVQPDWPPQLQVLARAGCGPRAALLLRLAAGLTDGDAASVLGISRASWRLAVRRALPDGDDGGADADAWRELAEHVQDLLRQLDSDRLSALAHMRETVLAGRAWRAPRAPRATAQPRPRWLWPALVAVALLTVAALGATFITSPLSSDRRMRGGPAQVRAEPLPADDVSGAAYSAEVALLTHPDLELLIAEGQDSAVRDPAFHAWLAAQLEAGRIEDVPAPAGTGQSGEVGDAD